MPDLIDCQADEKSTLITGLVAAIQPPPPRLSWRLRMRSWRPESLAFVERALDLLHEHHNQRAFCSSNIDLHSKKA